MEVRIPLPVVRCFPRPRPHKGRKGLKPRSSALSLGHFIQRCAHSMPWSPHCHGSWLGMNQENDLCSFPQTKGQTTIPVQVSGVGYGLAQLSGREKKKSNSPGRAAISYLRDFFEGLVCLGISLSLMPEFSSEIEPPYSAVYWDRNSPLGWKKRVPRFHERIYFTCLLLVQG